MLSWFILWPIDNSIALWRESLSIPGGRKIYQYHARARQKTVTLLIIIQSFVSLFISCDLVVVFNLFFPPVNHIFRQDHHETNYWSIACNWFLQYIFCLWTFIPRCQKEGAGERVMGWDEGEGGLQGKAPLVCQEALTTQSLRPLPSLSQFHYPSSDKISQWHPAPSHLQEAQTAT